MSSDTPPPASITCANCGRTETRPSMRFCPNCGALLPGLTKNTVSHAGFAALAQQLPPEEANPVSTNTSPAEPTPPPVLRQPWTFTQGPAPLLQQSLAPLEDDHSGPYLTQSLWGDRILGFVGEVSAVAAVIGILVATGATINSPIYFPIAILVAGTAILTFSLLQAKRLRETYPQLARGWYSGRSVWEHTVLPLFIGGIIVGGILLLLAPLGIFLICLGGQAILTLTPFLIVLAVIIAFLLGRGILSTIRRPKR